jgi:hypothetical protein
LTVLSVAAGRILVQRADGSLELRRADGKLAQAFPFERGQVLGAQLDASELVVLERASGLRWLVYDPKSGNLKRTLPARARALPADVERGRLVYTVGRVVYVLRLRDGHQKSFRAPAGTSQVLAQIEPTGSSTRTRCDDRVAFASSRSTRFGSGSERPRVSSSAQYHLPRAKPPKAMSPTSATISPIQKLHTNIRTIPTMTMIPPTVIPPYLRSAMPHSSRFDCPGDLFPCSISP